MILYVTHQNELPKSVTKIDLATTVMTGLVSDGRYFATKTLFKTLDAVFLDLIEVKQILTNFRHW